jgi:NAD(P)-dependent dehydrogenase (short-subunit alcohol dehydrogenase family)
MWVLGSVHCRPRGLPACQQVGHGHPGLRPCRAARVAGRGIYAGVLGGIEGRVESFAAELRPVRVNGVCAGAVDTELWHRLPEAERLATFERIGARLPVGRVGKPEDIAEAYLYLKPTSI